MLFAVYVQDLNPNGRALWVEGSYFATYAALFLVKFLVLDRVVFRSPRPSRVPLEGPVSRSALSSRLAR